MNEPKSEKVKFDQKQKEAKKKLDEAEKNLGKVVKALDASQRVRGRQGRPS